MSDGLNASGKEAGLPAIVLGVVEHDEYGRGDVVEIDWRSPDGVSLVILFDGIGVSIPVWKLARDAYLVSGDLKPFTDPWWRGQHEFEHEEEYERRAAHERRVNDKLRDLRALEEARGRLAAEKTADVDDADLYYDRQQLRDLPTAEPLITRVLPRNAYAVLRGRDHSFKSFVAIDWACCLATGRPWLGMRVEQTRVLYIAGEGAYGIAARIDAWEDANQTKVDPFMLTVRRAALNLHRPGPMFDRLLDRVVDGRYGLVVGDTLRRLSGSAEENRSDMGAVVDNLDLIKRATDRGSVLVVAHTGKDDHDTRGFSGIEDDADVVWHAKRDDDRVRLNLAKMKDGPDGLELHLAARNTGVSLVLDPVDAALSLDDPRITGNEQKILNAIRDAFPDGGAAGKIQSVSGVPESSFYRSAKRLRDLGLIVNTGSQKRAWLELKANVDSRALSFDQTAADQGDSHDSHPLSPTPDSLSLTPAPLERAGSESRNDENETP